MFWIWVVKLVWWVFCVIVIVVFVVSCFGCFIYIIGFVFGECMIVNINVRIDSVILISIIRCVVEGIWWIRVMIFIYILCFWKVGFFLIRIRYICGVKFCWRVLVSILWILFIYFRVRIYMFFFYVCIIVWSFNGGYFYGVVIFCVGDCIRRCFIFGGIFFVYVGRRVIGMV